MSRFSGVIFDMDGLLIDSEPFWMSADLEVYGRLGIDLTQHFKGETTGLRVDAAVEHWYSRFPWEGKSLRAVEDEIIAHVDLRIRTEGAGKSGAVALVRSLAAAGVPLAICSSSPLSLIQTVVEGLGIADAFAVLHSAEGEVYGKPHPAAYLSTAERLGAAPQSYLVFEDSLLGAIAAKAARMKVVAVPEGELIHSTRFDFCDLKIRSLEDFDVDAFLEQGLIQSLRKET